MNVADYRNVLMKDSWFRSLPDDLIARILDYGMIRDMPDGAYIFAAEDLPTGQFAILEGEVRLCLNTRQGKHVMFPIFTPGAWFGHLSVLDGLPRFQDAVAAGPTRLLFLSKSAFNRIIDEEPRYALDFARLLCRHIREAMTLLTEAQVGSLQARLAHILLDLSQNTEQTQRISQEALAAMTGTSRQTINRLLKRWEQQGAIAVRYGHVAVRDRAALRDVADGNGMLCTTARALG